MKQKLTKVRREMLQAEYRDAVKIYLKYDTERGKGNMERLDEKYDVQRSQKVLEMHLKIFAEYVPDYKIKNKTIWQKLEFILKDDQVINLLGVQKEAAGLH